MPCENRVFSTGPTEDVAKFAELRKRQPGRYFLEIIMDPLVDSGEAIRDMILEMRRNGILGYPEILLTRRMLDAFTPERFVDHLAPLGNIGAQVQFGRYSPSRTRGFASSQMLPVDEEVEWLARFAALVVERGYDMHPIPLGEYAVTLLDEYGEMAARGADGRVAEERLPEPTPFDARIVREKTRDILLTSLYVDHNLDLFVWSESMGQHVLDSNLGFKPLGNIRQRSIQDIVCEPGGGIDRMLSGIVRELVTHPKCSGCRYKSFCASHAVPLFRKWHPDDGRHCYGYLPVIREFQKDVAFLDNMVEGFKKLGF